MMLYKKQHGLSVIDFLITLPILLMFLLLVTEVSIMFYTLNGLNKSTQDAIRYLSQDKAGYATNLATAENLLRYGSPVNTGQPLLPNGNNNAILTFSPSQTVLGGTHVNVSVTFQHDLFMGSALGALIGISTGGGGGFGSTYQLNASSSMRFTR